MRKRPYLFTTLALAALALAVLLLYFWREATRDPLEGVVVPLYEQRVDTQKWDEIHDLTGSGNPLDPRFQNIPGEMETEVLSTSTNADGVTVERVKLTVPWEREAEEEFQFAFEPVTLTAPDFTWQDGPVKISVASFEFKDYRLEEDPERTGIMQTQFYLPPAHTNTTPAWQRGPKLEPEGWKREFRPDYPETTLEVNLRIAGVPGVRATHQPVFDRRNRRQVCNGWGMSVRQGRTKLESRPAELRADFDMPTNYDILPLTASDAFLGPVDVHAWNPREQPVLETPQFQVRYLGALPGKAKNVKRDYRTRDPVFRLEMDRIVEPDNSVHLFAVNPQETQLRLDFDFGDAYEGEEGTGWLPPVRIFNLNIPEDELGTVRIKYYPRAVRIFTEVPILPVAPENRRLENGLDMRLPLVRIDERYDFLRIPTNALHMGYTAAGSAGTDPNFPLTYENITLRELLNEYLHHYPNHTISYDPIDENLKIEIKREKLQPWDPAVNWVQEQFKTP